MGMKRLLALAVALCLCLSILPGAAWETTSGTIGESHVSWSFDETSGRLTISGSGGCEAFESAEDQPWAALRTEIRRSGSTTRQTWPLKTWPTGLPTAST